MAFAPMAMHGAPARAATSAHHVEAGTPHCAGGSDRQDQTERGRAADCAIACSAMPERTHLCQPAPLPCPAFAAALSAFVAGSAPGSDPPPPRTA
jgi:hypothetical protein